MAMQTVLTMQEGEGIANFLPSKPTILKQGKASPDWPHWKGVVDPRWRGSLKTGGGDQVPRATNKLIVGTNMLYCTV